MPDLYDPNLYNSMISTTGPAPFPGPGFLDSGFGQVLDQIVTAGLNGAIPFFDPLPSGTLGSIVNWMKGLNPDQNAWTPTMSNQPNPYETGGLAQQQVEESGFAQNWLNAMGSQFELEQAQNPYIASNTPTTQQDAISGGATSGTSGPPPTQTGTNMPTDNWTTPGLTGFPYLAQQIAKSLGLPDNFLQNMPAIQGPLGEALSSFYTSITPSDVTNWMSGQTGGAGGGPLVDASNQALQAGMNASLPGADVVIPQNIQAAAAGQGFGGDYANNMMEGSAFALNKLYGDTAGSANMFTGAAPGQLAKGQYGQDYSQGTLQSVLEGQSPLTSQSIGLNQNMFAPGGAAGAVPTPTMMDPLGQQIYTQMTQGGLTPEFVQAQRNLVLDPAIEARRGEFNQQTGGAAIPGPSGLYQEQQRRLERDFMDQMLGYGFQSQQNAMNQALPYAQAQYDMPAADQQRWLNAVVQNTAAQGQYAQEAMQAAGQMGQTGTGQIDQSQSMAGFGPQNVLPITQTGFGAGQVAAEYPLKAATAGVGMLAPLMDWIQGPLDMQLKAAGMSQEQINNASDTMVGLLGQASQLATAGGGANLSYLSTILNYVTQNLGSERDYDMGMKAASSKQ